MIHVPDSYEFPYDDLNESLKDSLAQFVYSKYWRTYWLILFNSTVISLTFMNKNIKISQKPVAKATQECLMEHSLGKNQNSIDYFMRKLIFVDLALFLG